ncbi:sensor histidine kinase [Dactylosporangium sp. CA-092794]|uniref:sensor histidine kinase n=1 Tax=Dactylosporangium sp. CA-092794 TaxID=3239929 RepID=UPI003D9453C6
MDRFVAYAALCRALLLGRLAISFAAVGVGIRLVDDRWRAIATLVLIGVTTLAQVWALSRFPHIVRWRLPVLAVDAALVLCVLLLSDGGVAYFCYAAGSAALAGSLLGTGGLPLWVAHAALGSAVSVQLLRGAEPLAAPGHLAQFVVALPMTDIVCGLGAAALTGAVARYIDMSVAAMAAAQRSAAASERARLARELHDSVTKTLRGVSFAALALPTSLRRHPDLAEQLAMTVSEGADAAVRESRELLAALRRDMPDRPFAETLRSVCETWQRTTGVRVDLTAAPVEPSLAARYELTQILHEALRNATNHGHATLVTVVLATAGGTISLSVRDNGAGFAVPAELTALSAAGSFGIVGMAERAQAAGGTLDIRSHQGAGTLLVAQVPAASAPAGVATRTVPR